MARTLSLADIASLGVGFKGLTNPRGLRRFKAKLGNVQRAPVYIDCYGDSITEGVGTENANTIADNVVADTLGWPGQLRSLLAQQFGTFPGGMITPAFNGADSRVSFGGSQTVDPTCGTGMRRGVRVTPTNIFTATLPLGATAFDVLYYAGGSQDGTFTGGFSYSVDGAAAVTGLAAGVNASPGYRVLTVPGLSASTAHAVQIAGLDASKIQHISGISYHTGKGVVVRRNAAAGWTVWDALGIGVGARNSSAADPISQARMLGAYGGYSPALGIVSFAPNDAGQQQTLQLNGAGELGSIENYEIRLRTICQKIVDSGASVLLLNAGLPPLENNLTPAKIYDYHMVGRKIALSMDHVAHFTMADQYGKVGDATSPEVFTLGLLAASNSQHPSVLGFGDMSRNLASILTGPLQLPAY
jgi:hypothetical protein